MEFLKGILNWLYTITGNYGWAMVVFTLLVRLVLLPFDYKSRVGMRKTTALQPKITELQQKYGKDQEKLNRKMQELYQKEKVSPLSGCLPMLLSYPILILMFNAMRAIANEQLVQQVISVLQNPQTMPALDGWLWIKNLWMPDSPFSAVLPDLNTLRVVPADVWQRLMTPEVIASLPAELSSLTQESFSSGSLGATLPQLFTVLAATPAYASATATVPGWANLSFLGLISITLYQHFNGLFLLPLTSALSQFLMTKVAPTQQTPTAGSEAQASAQGMSKFMTWFFPIFSLWICASSNVSFALYWVVSNLIAIVMTYCINKYLDKKDKAEAKKHLAEGKIV